MAAVRRRLWYWAWLVQMTVGKGRRQRGLSRAQVWRNLVLIQARNGAEALSKAEAIGRSSTGDADGTLVLGGHPARTVFLGIADAGLVDYNLGDGVEVMFQLDGESTRGARRVAQTRPALLARLAHETRQLHASRSIRIPGVTGSNAEVRVGNRNR